MSKLRLRAEFTPEGYEEVGIAFYGRGEIVITGSPPDDSDLPEEAQHNCDEMGCGQDHVLYRIKV